MTGVRGRIVDAHAHLWSPTVAEASWLRSSESARLRRAFVAADFAAASAETRASAAIAVVAGETLEETRWLLRETDTTSLFGGVVGWIDAREAPGAQLDDLASTVLGVPLVGIRYPGVADSAVLISDQLSGLMIELGKRGITFDLLVRTNGLADAVECVRSHPDTVFVLDHLGNPPAEAEGQQTWVRGLRELARSENIRAKISGLTVAHKTQKSIAQIVDVALTEFGPARLMLGSDWPVSTLATKYEATLDRYLAAINALSDSEQEDIQRTTAMQTYRGAYDREG